MLKPLFKYADFKGRANRAEYWLFGLFQVILYIGIMAVSVGLAASGSIGAAVGTGLLLFVVVALGCFVPNLAVTVRRLHDSNRSAWWLLLYLPSAMVLSLFIPALAQGAHESPSNTFYAIIGGLIHLAPAAAPLALLSLISQLCQLLMFLWLVWPGTRGPNRFGDDWRGGGLDLTVFDAPQDMAPSEAAKPPHKPIFDFTSPEPAAAQPVSAPAPAPVTYQPAPATSRQGPVFGKRR